MIRSLAPLPSRTSISFGEKSISWHPQGQAFHQAQTRAIHQRSHEPPVTRKVGQHGLDFLARHDHRKTPGLAGADDLGEIPDFAVENVAVGEQQRRKRPVLCRGADLVLDREMGQKGIDLRFGHLGGVAHVVEEDVPLDPMAIRLFRAWAGVTRAQGLRQPVWQLRLRHADRLRHTVCAGSASLDGPKGRTAGPSRRVAPVYAQHGFLVHLTAC